MGGKKTTTKTNQTQTAAPPTWTQPGLEQAAQMVTSGLGQIPTTHYSGPMVATMDPADVARIQAAWGATAGNASGLSSWMQGLLPNLEDGMSFSTNLPSTAYSLAPRQELDNVIRASIDPVQRQLMEQVLPGLTNSALQAGAYSGDRAMKVLPTEAIRQANESMQRIASQLGYEDYQNYENRRLQAWEASTGAAQQNYALDTSRQTADQQAELARMSLIPDYVNSILHTQASTGDLLRMAAELGQSQQQLGYNNAIQQDQYASQAPFMGLDTATQLLTALSGGWGTQTMQGQTTTKSKDPLLPQLIQGAVGVGQMAMGMPPTAFAGMGGGTTMPSAAAMFALPAQVSPSINASPVPYMQPNWPVMPGWTGG